MGRDRIVIALVLLGISCGGKIELSSSPSPSRAPGDEASSSSASPPRRPDPSPPSSSSSEEPSLPPPPSGGSAPGPTPPASCAPKIVPPPFVADVTLSDLADAKSSMVGHWCGTQSNPWTGCYEVDLRFDANGHYSARSVDSWYGPAFYWGTDDDTPLKKWRLEDALANGTVTGEIDVAFAYGGSQYGLPSWQGLLDDLAFDAARDRLRFEMRRDDGYGPLVFDLARCP
jgi:hypothetical protein